MALDVSAVAHSQARLEMTQNIMWKLSIGETLNEKERFYVTLVLGFFIGAVSTEAKIELEQAEKAKVEAEKKDVWNEDG